MADVAEQNEQLLRAYAMAFNSPAGQMVLTDLAKFCRGAETCIVPGDIHTTLVLEGRREALLRIMHFAKLNEEQILHLRLGRIRPQAVE